MENYLSQNTYNSINLSVFFNENDNKKKPIPITIPTEQPKKITDSVDTSKTEKRN